MKGSSGYARINTGRYDGETAKKRAGKKEEESDDLRNGLEHLVGEYEKLDAIYSVHVTIRMNNHYMDVWCNKSGGALQLPRIEYEMAENEVRLEKDRFHYLRLKEVYEDDCKKFTEKYEVSGGGDRATSAPPRLNQQSFSSRITPQRSQSAAPGSGQEELRRGRETSRGGFQTHGCSQR